MSKQEGLTFRTFEDKKNGDWFAEMDAGLEMGGKIQSHAFNTWEEAEAELLNMLQTLCSEIAGRPVSQREVIEFVKKHQG